MRAEVCRKGPIVQLGPGLVQGLRGLTGPARHVTRLAFNLDLLMLLALLLPSLLGCGMMEAQTKDGTRVYLMTAGEPLAVSINGDEDKRLGDPVALGLGPGTHSIAVRDGAQVSVTLEPFDRIVVPLVPNQCFISLNVSLSNYGGGDQKVPKIQGRMQRSAPFAMPKDHYVSDAALPDSITSGQQVFLLRSTPCHVADDLEYGLNGQVSREDGSRDAVASSVAVVRRAACKEKTEWCAALEGWSALEESPLPAAPQGFIGLSVAAAAGAKEIELDPKEMPLSVLTLSADGGALTGLLGSNPKEEGQLALTAQSVAKVLNKESELLSVGAELDGYLQERAKAGATKATAQGAGWMLEGAELRKVGAYWVSVEPLPEGEGHFVSVHSPYKLLPN